MKEKKKGMSNRKRNCDENGSITVDIKNETAYTTTAEMTNPTYGLVSLLEQVWTASWSHTNIDLIKLQNVKVSVSPVQMNKCTKFFLCKSCERFQGTNKQFQDVSGP